MGSVNTDLYNKTEKQNCMGAMSKALQQIENECKILGKGPYGGSMIVLSESTNKSFEKYTELPKMTPFWINFTKNMQ